MNSNAPLSLSRDDRLAEALDAYLAAQEGGTPPDMDEFLARYPELAGELRECLASLAFIRKAGNLSAAVDSPTEGEPAGTLGDFRIVREVGRGGMGVVYEAEQISLRRRVALKVLPFAATMDPRHLQRFHNEAQAAACLHHTNIVPVFFVGCERGVHFYAMQFIDGQPLSDVIHRLCQLERKAPTAEGEQTVAYQPSSGGDATSTPPVGALTPLTGGGRRSRDYHRKVAELGVQAAEALDHAHQLGIVHRDIKPANLLLDGRGNLWVTDFGLAHVQHGEASLTGTGQMVGTPRYMSPEQALAKRVPIDHRTDVYSLGATLYELLTLRPAFVSEDRQELLRQIAFEEPPRLRRLERTIPAELEIIVLKAMEKRPQDRYSTAHELAEDLERWLRHEPIRARRPTLLQLAAKWVRRHKPLAAAGGMVLLMALILAGYIGWTRHERTLRRAASEEVIRAALEETYDWQGKRWMPEALSAAQRANGLMAGSDVDVALRRLVQARLADLELLKKLENVRLEHASSVKGAHFDREGTDRLYGQIFRDWGLDVEALSAEEAAERIRGSTVAVELAAVLDEWAIARKHTTGMDDPSRRMLLQIARLADLDPWRTRVRQALERKDRQTLQELASSDDVLRLPPETLGLLGSAVGDEKVIRVQAEAFLREAQRLYPNDFWINYNLFVFFRGLQPPQREEAFHFAAVAVALRPQSPGAHVNLGVALKDMGRLDAAIAQFQDAIRLKEDYASAHLNLGSAFAQKGRLDEAITEYRAAIRLEKDGPAAHYSLGLALRGKGRLDEAIAECREAIRLDKDDPEAHFNLGSVLQGSGRLDEAIAECREAIRLNKDEPDAHYNLGVALKSKGRLDEAIAQFQEAIRLKKDHAGAHNNLGTSLGMKDRLDEAIAQFQEAIRFDKDYAEAHYNLGLALAKKNRLDQAIAEYREAIRLNKDHAEAHCNLGHVLRDQGRFADAHESFRRGHELGARNPRWPYPSAQWVRYCERLVELDGKLPAILSGEKQPADAGERLALARLCQMPCKKRYADAVRFFREAFAAEPRRAEDPNARHRYNAACAAAMAGCGQSKDADMIVAEERARLRQQAIAWLRADLKAYRQVLEKSADQAGPAIAQRMQHWLQDGDFSSLRGDKALAKLPAEERSEWRKLWADIAELLAKAQGKTPAEKKPKAKK